MKTPIRLLALLLFACLLKPAAAADLAPSWTLVPESTVLIARASPAKFLEALRRQTKFGAVVLSEDRVARGLELFKSENSAKWEAMVKDLGEVGLKPEELAGLLAGDTGFALAVEPRGERAPLMVGLTWLEPGEELAERTIKAVQAMLEKLADDPHAPQRVDLDLAGREVMHLTIPVMRPENLDAEDFAPEEDDDDETPSPESLQKRREALIEKLKNRKTIEADRVHVFVARVEGRLLVANTFGQASAEVLAQDEEERGKLDWDKLTGVEEATGVFARFLEAHAGQGAGHAAELLNVPGLAAALPEGVPLFEIIGDPRPLVKLLTGAQKELEETLKTLGLDAVGPLAIRTALDGTVFRGGVFLSAPEPRGGVLSLLDQTPLTPAPPAWVPASALDFQQFSFDLGVAFAKIKELAISMGGDQARQGFVRIETPVQTFLQTDLVTLLSSLGHEHSVVSFVPKTDAAAATDEDEPAAAVSQRAGVVWQVKDEQLWQRVMQTIGQFAPAAGGAVQAAEEQGFNGYRIQQGPAPLGLFLGRGYLVLGIGEEVTESLLSVLRNPPQGKASMAASGLVERAAALLPPAPCLTYQLGDGGLSVKTTKRAIEQLIDLPLEQRARLARLPGSAIDPGDTAAATALAAKLKALVPSDDELEGVLGVSVGQTMVNEHGLSGQSAVELPAP